MNTLQVLDEVSFWSRTVGVLLACGLILGRGRWLCRWHDVRFWGKDLSLPCPGCNLIVKRHKRTRCVKVRPDNH